MNTSERSKKLFAEAKEHFPGGVNSPVRSWKSVGAEPFIVARGEGPYLFDLDGNRYVDYICSWGPLVLGHAPAAVKEAMNMQLSKGWSYGAPSEPENLLATELKKHIPALEMMRFVSSGTEAVMHTVRLARGFTGRNKILKFSGCFHGASDPLLVEAGSGVATLGIPGSAGVLDVVAANTLTAPFNDLDAVEEIFRKHSDDIALVVLEPVIGNSGFIPPRDGYLKGLREITSRYGALLCFDEVMTGFRVSLKSAQGLYEVTPDLMTFGKVIGGGQPVGMYGGRRDIMESVAPLGPVYQAGTLSGNPVAMVAGLTTLHEWLKPGVFDEAARLTASLVMGLKESAKKIGVPFTADSIGTMFGFFFQEGPVHSYEDAKKSNKDLFNKFFHLMVERGVYFAPSPFEAGFTSATHSAEVIQFTLDAAAEAFSKL